MGRITFGLLCYQTRDHYSSESGGGEIMRFSRKGQGYHRQREVQELISKPTQDLLVIAPVLPNLHL